MESIDVEKINEATMIGTQILNDLKRIFCSVDKISRADELGNNKIKTIKKLQDLDPVVCSIPSIPKFDL